MLPEKVLKQAQAELLEYGGSGTMTEAECRAEIRKFFMELYSACTVIYAYPGNAARPTAPYVVLDFDAADSSQIDGGQQPL